MKNKYSFTVQRKCRAEGLGRGAQKRTMLLRSSGEASRWTWVWARAGKTRGTRFQEVETAVMGVLLPVPKKHVCMNGPEGCMCHDVRICYSPGGGSSGQWLLLVIVSAPGALVAPKLTVVWVPRGKKARGCLVLLHTGKISARGRLGTDKPQFLPGKV